MPAMNGWEFIDHYKRIPHKENRKVIVMLTSSVNRDDPLRASSISEITDHMHKPLSHSLLKELLRKHFPKLV